jgi:hypothetical protein
VPQDCGARAQRLFKLSEEISRLPSDAPLDAESSASELRAGGGQELARSARTASPPPTLTLELAIELLVARGLNDVPDYVLQMVRSPARNCPTIGEDIGIDAGGLALLSMFSLRAFFPHLCRELTSLTGEGGSPVDARLLAATNRLQSLQASFDEALTEAETSGQPLIESLMTPDEQDSDSEEEDSEVRETTQRLARLGRQLADAVDAVANALAEREAKQA